MPDTTLLDIPEEEQAQMLAALSRARYEILAIKAICRSQGGAECA